METAAFSPGMQSTRHDPVLRTESVYAFFSRSFPFAVQVRGLRVIRIEYAAIHGLYAVQVCSAGHAFREGVQLSVI